MGPSALQQEQSCENNKQTGSAAEYFFRVLPVPFSQPDRRKRRSAHSYEG